jgi:hypothetical protein
VPEQLPEQHDVLSSRLQLDESTGPWRRTVAAHGGKAKAVKAKAGVGGVPPDRVRF